VNSISNKTRVLEISAVVLTAAGKFIFMDYLNWRLPFVVIAITCWVLYVIKRNKEIPGITKYWGFRTDNINKVLKTVLLFGILTLVACITAGIYLGTINITWHIIPILVLYPIWGTIQQFLLIALTSGNLSDLKNSNLNKIFIVFISAILFGLIHYPYIWLMIGTFVLAIFYGFIYMKERNLYVLGVFHGWLGAIFYYTVVDRDPFLETFGRLYNL
jgi:membrane protease YdiL (CAAX protease family)